MGEIKTVELTGAQRAALEKGYRTGPSHAFRLRCQMILLKSERRTAVEIADLPGCCGVVVNNWLKRYEAGGVDGLRAKPGRGRKPPLDAGQDLESVKATVAANRQRISVARAELEAESGKSFSTKTLQRYIKNMAAAINESESVRPRSRARKSTS